MNDYSVKIIGKSSNFFGFSHRQLFASHHDHCSYEKIGGSHPVCFVSGTYTSCSLVGTKSGNECVKRRQAGEVSTVSVASDLL